VEGRKKRRKEGRKEEETENQKALLPYFCPVLSRGGCRSPCWRRRQTRVRAEEGRGGEEAIIKQVMSLL
jgi:hypothetical protein